MKLVSIADAGAEGRKANADEIREMADAIERGDIIEWVMVANDRAREVYLNHSKFEDRWRMLGALEYARSGLLKAGEE
ncbi:hypothetical protein [Sphingobium sp. TCM1]|uniref:hypothetical protein n=1 Tax=Sphingobium sp. TCM1 TaxID=453246 RepID=UPI0007F3E4F3|nr:hypothetical protein [Sphingobium sp. TCM1]OAN56937.1 hypothetical protein A7Q26_17735 [Sphingobium sp. TCM1]